MRGAGDTQIVQVLLNTGMNESIAERMAPTGVLRECTNMRLRDGQLVKRGGCTQSEGGSSVALLVGAGGLTGPYPAFISRCADVPLIGHSEGGVFTYSATQDYFSYQGRISTCRPVRERNGFALLTPDAAATALALGECPPSVAVDSNGYLAATVCDSGGTLYALWIESPQGERVYFESDTNSYTRSQVVATSDGFMLIVQVGTALRAKLITVGDTVTAAAFTGVGTLNNANSHWDTSARGSAAGYTAPQKQQWALAFHAGAATVRLLIFHNVTQDNLIDYNLATGNLPACSVWLDNTGSTKYAWVGFYDDPAATGVISYAVYDSSLGSNVLALTTISATASAEYGPPLFGQFRNRISLAGNTADTAFLVVRRANAAGSCWAYYGSATSAGVSSMASTVPGVLPLGKPDNFMRVWCLAAHGDTGQLEQRAVLVELTQLPAAVGRAVMLASPSQPAMPVAISPLASAHRYRWLSGPAHAVDDADGPSFFAFPFVLTQIEGASGSTQALSKCAVYEYTTTLEDYAQACLPCGQSSLVGGQPTEVYAFPQGSPTPTVYVATSECGFAHSPTIVGSITTTAAAGPGVGTYSYRAVYEWVDVYGRRHRSAPSAAKSVTLTTGLQRPRLSVSSLHMSQRTITQEFGPQIILYRTLDGGDGYHRIQATADAYDLTGLVTIDDASLDSEIDANEFIYTDGGVLDFSLGPSCAFLARAEDRAWCGGLWDPTLVQCSRVIIPGEPIQFAEHASHQVALGEACTALAYMDGNTIAFTRAAIYLISGDGPNEQGIGGFPPPRVHTSGIGCDNWRSVVQTNAGVFFQNRKGIYLIPRGFGPVQYISAPVRHALNATPVCLGASYVDGDVATDAVLNDAGPGHQSMVKWLLSTSLQTAATVTLALDLVTGQWFKDTHAKSLFALGTWPIPVDSLRTTALVSARATQLISGGAQAQKVIEFDSANFGDAAPVVDSYITQTLKTTWVSPFGLGGWGQIRRALFVFEREPSAASDSPVDVTLTIQTDANTSQSKTWRIQNGTSGSGAGIEFREMILADSKCTSLQATIGDAYVSPDTHGRGIRPMALVFEVESNGSLRLTTETERG